MSQRLWTPVVYGRTRMVDEWWRAAPADPALVQWLRRVVPATVYGGRDLADEPRFLLARSGRHLAVGIGCMATALAPEFGEQPPGRPLLAFVGWVADVDPKAPGEDADTAPPGLGELTAHWRTWAEPDFRSWVGRDWEAAPGTLFGAHASEPGPAPWASTRAGILPETDATDPKVTLTEYERHTLHLCPADRASELWQIGVRTPATFALIAGWRFVPDATDDRLAGASHLIAPVANIEHVRRGPQPNPASPSRDRGRSSAREPHPSGGAGDQRVREHRAREEREGEERSRREREQHMRTDDRRIRAEELRQRYPDGPPGMAEGTFSGIGRDVGRLFDRAFQLIGIGGDDEDRGSEPGMDPADHPQSGHPQRRPADGSATGGPGPARPDRKHGPVPGRSSEAKPEDVSFDDLFE